MCTYIFRITYGILRSSSLVAPALNKHTQCESVVKSSVVIYCELVSWNRRNNCQNVSQPRINPTCQLLNRIFNKFIFAHYVVRNALYLCILMGISYTMSFSKCPSTKIQLPNKIMVQSSPFHSCISHLYPNMVSSTAPPRVSLTTYITTCLLQMAVIQ